MSMQTEEEVRAAFAAMGEEAFRLEYGRLAQSGLSHPTVNTVKAIFADLDREAEERHRRGEADRGAETVGHADNANRIARRANFFSAAALIVAVGALIASLIALRG